MADNAYLCSRKNKKLSNYNNRVWGYVTYTKACNAIKRFFDTDMKLRYLMIATVAIMLVSCSTNTTSLTYFEDIKRVESGVLSSGSYDVKIIPDDELFISVTSFIPSATAAYNLPLSNPATREDMQITTQPQQQCYIVDKNGDIMFPVLGRIHVAGMSTQELTKELEKRIGENVDDPVVRVELMNFRVNVLGEVKKPGAVSVKRERYTLLDALADAGDLTEYGERDNVLLIREENGQRTYHHLNLNDSKILTSPYFYLQQNDVVYVEPNKIRKDNSKYNQNNAYKISVISTIVSACSVIASLVIALTVK